MRRMMEQQGAAGETQSERDVGPGMLKQEEAVKSVIVNT